MLSSKDNKSGALLLPGNSLLRSCGAVRECNVDSGVAASETVCRVVLTAVLVQTDSRTLTGLTPC